MASLSKINEWSENNAPKWLWGLRLALGICLFFKGIMFLQDHTLIMRVVSESTVAVKQNWIIKTIPWVHMFGGAFILLGLLTRVVCLVQIPVLIGAVVINLLQKGNINGTELSLAIVILLLLIVFLIVGGGSYSLDKGLRHPNNIEALYN